MAVQQEGRRLRARLHEAERLLAARSAAAPGRRVTRVLPLLLIATMLLWIAAPVHWLAALTPWVGAAALCCAGIYLARVVLRMGHFYWQHLAEEDAAGAHAGSLRSAMWQTVFVLLGTLLLAASFFVLSTQLLADSGSGAQSRLLWALTVGGMILSLFFGELVTRLIEAVDAVLMQQRAGGEP